MTIKLFGDVTSDEWVWLYDLFSLPCCSPKTVRDAIAQLPADEDLIIEVNSPGGDVWAVFEIFGLLQSLGERTEAHIIAMAASAATTITSACARVFASPVAQIMIHQPAVSAWGSYNNEDAGRLLNFLDSVKASIINGYLVKCGGKTSRRTLEKLVDQNTWMPAQDAIKLGLVDGLLDTTEEKEAMITAGGGVSVTNSAAGNNVASLLKSYEAAVKAGTMDEVPGHPVKRENAQAPETEPTEAETGAQVGEPGAQVGEPGAQVGEPGAQVNRSEEDLLTPERFAAEHAKETYVPGKKDFAEDPAVTERREVVENLISNWRLQAAIDLEREKVPV